MGAKLVRHVVERRSQLSDLVVASDRGPSIQIPAGDPCRRPRQILERPHHAMQRQLHRGKAAQDDDPGDSQPCGHHRARLALQARSLAGDLELPLADQVLRRSNDLRRGGVTLRLGGFRVTEQMGKTIHALPKPRRVDAR